MINPIKGEMAFDADGRQYVLQYNINAVCTLEGQTGKGFIALVQELEQNPTMTLIRQMLWVGLLKHQPEITLEEAGELIPAVGGLVGAMDLFNKAFARGFEKPGGKPRPREGGKPQEWDWPALYRDWCSLGRDDESFWRKTPGQIALIFEAEKLALEREHNARAWLAWHIAAMHRCKRLPRIEKLLFKQQQRTKQTWQEQLAIMDRWVAVTRRIEAARRQ